MPTILSGRVARDEIKKSLIAKIKTLREKQGATLILAIIQVGDRADSTAYINAKKKFAAEIGVDVKLIHLQESIGQEEIISEIKKLNQDKGITGIIVQLPLPKNLNEQVILGAVAPSKDADAITSTNVKKWMGQDFVQAVILYPATARGVAQLLDFYNISLKRKNVCVIGRSRFVGTPIACLCRAKGALVTVCHSKTKDLVKETVAADVIISVVGKAGLITAEHVRSGQIVVDVGLSRVNGKLVGDVDFEKVSAILGDNGAITPVPGGVGPMTVLALFENLLDCAKM
jgi:methylenetetrahydrofolate dehydrogenase (NADP+)/methenyltetrahydrofolate cyclohydrolase